MTAEEKLNEIRLHVYKEMKRYNELFSDDLKNHNTIEMAMDREATRVLTKIKIILEED